MQFKGMTADCIHTSLTGVMCFSARDQTIREHIYPINEIRLLLFNDPFRAIESQRAPMKQMAREKRCPAHVRQTELRNTT